MSGSLFGPTLPAGGGGDGGGGALPGVWAGTVLAAAFTGSPLTATVTFTSPHPSGTNYSITFDDGVVAASGLDLSLSWENKTATGFDIVLNTAGPVPNLIQVDWQVQPYGEGGGSGSGDPSLPGLQNTIIVDKGTNTTENGSQQFPFHTVAAATAVAASGDTILVYPGNYSETAVLTEQDFLVIRGIDPTRTTIQAGPGTGGVLMAITGVTQGVTFANINLVGNFTVNGTGAELYLTENTTLEGSVELLGAGVSVPRLEVSESTIEAVETELAAIILRAQNSSVLIEKHSEVIGWSPANGGTPTPAIYWDSTSNFVRIAHSRVQHGNNSLIPFDRSGLQTPTYRSHHSTFNQDPESTGIWTNGISPGQRYDNFGAGF